MAYKVLLQIKNLTTGEVVPVSIYENIPSILNGIRGIIYTMVNSNQILFYKWRIKKGYADYIENYNRPINDAMRNEFRFYNEDKLENKIKRWENVQNQEYAPDIQKIFGKRFSDADKETIVALWESDKQGIKWGNELYIINIVPYMQ